MTIQLSTAISCAYAQCDQDGHAACPVMKAHIEELHTTVADLLCCLEHGTKPSESHVAAARALLDFDDYAQTKAHMKESQ